MLICYVTETSMGNSNAEREPAWRVRPHGDLYKAHDVERAELRREHDLERANLRKAHHLELARASRLIRSRLSKAVMRWLDKLRTATSMRSPPSRCVLPIRPQEEVPERVATTGAIE
jgi:hypothetical protein